MIRNCPIIAFAALGALIGCSDPTGDASGIRLTAMVASGDSQVGVAGVRLPAPLQVRVLRDSQPASGVVVAWSTADGSIVTASDTTDASGIAGATWILGGTAGGMSASVAVEGAPGGPLVFQAVALARPSLMIDSASNGQTGMVGGALVRPLRVLVASGNAPATGLRVTWQPSGGHITPASSIVDAFGYATASWTLDTVAGAARVQALVDGVAGSGAWFDATALPGPPVAIAIKSGDSQTRPANRWSFAEPLLAKVSDRYGNENQAVDVEWSIESGPLTFRSRGGAVAVVAPLGTLGEGIVRAALPGARSVDFALTVTPMAGYDVVLQASSGYAFQSMQNGTSGPAVDTIPVGATLTWELAPLGDYEGHGVISMGSPSFSGGGDFTYSGSLAPTVTATFSQPGSYTYRDPYFPDVTGVVVVQ